MRKGSTRLGGKHAGARGPADRYGRVANKVQACTPLRWRHRRIQVPSLLLLLLLLLLFPLLAVVAVPARLHDKGGAHLR